MKAVIIRTDDTVEVIDHLPTYEELNKAVGGYIEAVPLLEDAIMWANEDGLRLGLELNEVASLLSRAFSEVKTPVVGNVIITGRRDPEVGDLPEWVLHQINLWGLTPTNEGGN